MRSDLFQARKEFAQAVELPTTDMGGMNPLERINWVYKNYGRSMVLGSSFGVQAAIMIDLVRKIDPRIPVLNVVTDDVSEETARYKNDMQALLGLNMMIVDARHYGGDKRAATNAGLEQLGARAVLYGIRHDQTEHRAKNKKLLEVDEQNQRLLVHPILDMDEKWAQNYLHGLPSELRHPAHAFGKLSIGDTLLARMKRRQNAACMIIS